MKKTLSILTVLLVMISLIGCNANKNQNALNSGKDTIDRNTQNNRDNSQLEYGSKNNLSQGRNNLARNDLSRNTTTRIKHIVVIFGENVSFDHYFGTYPHAANTPGEPKFVAKRNTPLVNGLEPNARNGNLDLINHNPNSANPKRFGRSQAWTADMDHEYKAEQQAFDGGKMDKFVEYTSGGNEKTLVMNYFDGNTVTALWNYAQHFAMSDNSFGTVYGPSTPGALNLISGQTHGATGYQSGKAVGDIKGNVANGTVIGDPDPYFDSASSPTRAQAAMSGKNVGDLLNQKGVSWGWFQGGFRDVTAQHKNIGGVQSIDYNPHHQPFQYYQSTSNKDHLRPSSIELIGRQGDQANHQYDLTDFWDAVDAHNMPAVSFLKAANFQDAHAGYSDPIDEQHFLVDTINRLQKTPEWNETAVILAYDDSDGWYDHAYHAPVNGSNDPQYDALFGPGDAGKPVLGNYLDRAGYGPRLPLMVISPYAKSNYVDHTLTDQTSILKFIEDNWQLGRIGDYSFDSIAGSINNMFDFRHGNNKNLFLDPETGQPIYK
jgi:phospholipase C